MTHSTLLDTRDVDGLAVAGSVVPLPVAPTPTPTPTTSVQGTLALDLGPRLDPPEPDVRARPGDSARLDVVRVDLVRRRRFEQHAVRIGAALVEIVGGDRPVSQVLRWTTPEVRPDRGPRARRR